MRKELVSHGFMSRGSLARGSEKVKRSGTGWSVVRDGGRGAGRGEVRDGGGCGVPVGVKRPLSGLRRDILYSRLKRSVCFDVL